MARLDASTVLLQWAAGGLFFLWITTRRRAVGIGYDWLLRAVYAVMAIGASIGCLNCLRGSQRAGKQMPH